jgi:hypothetical protein
MYKRIKRAAMALCALGSVMVLIAILTRMGKVKIYVLAEAAEFLIVAILLVVLRFSDSTNIAPKDRTPAPLPVAVLWAGAALFHFYIALCVGTLK